MERVTIRVPATTANLAAGFDVLGCAVVVSTALSFFTLFFWITLFKQLSMF